MLAARRRSLILDSVRADGSVSVRTLAERFDASNVTIRRDLVLLDSRHLLTRTHGGAIERHPSRESSYAEKTLQWILEKRAIAELAASAVRDGDVIIVGPGTTTEAVARALLHRRNLTIVTNSLPAAEIFALSPQNQVIMTGGELRGPIRALVGEAAQRTVSKVRASITFLSGNGLTAEFGLSTPNLAVAGTDRAMADAGERVIVVADHSKIGARAALQTMPAETIDVLVTDAGSSASELSALRDIGVDVEVAGISAGLLDRI